MAITVKDVTGAEHSVASRGVGIGGLTTGIIGTSLAGLMALGAGSGLLGGGGAGVVGTSGMYVTKDQYYQERIQDIRDNNLAFNGLQLQLCALGERVAVNETANAYQNRIVDMGFAAIDTRFGTERQITDYEVRAATCDFIKAQKVLTPNMIAEPFVKSDRAIDSHPVFPFYNRPLGGYNDGCGCGCRG